MGGSGGIHPRMLATHRLRDWALILSATEARMKNAQALWLGRWSLDRGSHSLPLAASQCIAALEVAQAFGPAARTLSDISNFLSFSRKSFASLVAVSS